MRKQLTLKAAAQAGFTLIELIIVIVIIGILAAVAIPKFFAVTDDANKAVANATAGAFASAAAVNFAVCSGSTAAAACVTLGVLDCNDAGLAAMVTTVPTGISIKAGSTAAACTLVKGGQDSDPVVIKTL